MSRFFRFLSRRRTGRGFKSDSYLGEKSKKGLIVCRVILLDGTDIPVELTVGVHSFVCMSASF